MTGIPVFYINLKVSAARRMWFEEQMRTLGPESHRVEAVDGHAISPASLGAQRTKRRYTKFPMGPAEIGCFLSHRRAWSRALAATDEWGAPWAFIAEDDLHLSQDCKVFFEGVGWIPADAHMIKAETTFRKCHCSRWSGPAHGGRTLVRLMSLHGGSGGYFLSRQALRDALDATENLCEPVDYILFNPELGLFPRWAVYQITPAFALQDLFFENTAPGFEKSILQGERDEHKKNTRGPHRCLREIIRPFRQLRDSLRQRFFARCHNTIFRSVPYQDKVGTSPLYNKKRRFL
ncbi:MAG: glycosyltransferase family 25 protein [Rhodobacteraceae bacterium]|nr:glycosyltransferase family 25 protein [Paracoccaceae bacterium]